MPIQRWRCPVVPRVKSALAGAIGAGAALVFLPVWFGVPVAAVCAVWGLGLAALGASVLVDEEDGLLVLRMGVIVRRIRLADVTAVLVDEAKVSVARAGGGEVSVYAWRKGPLDALLGVPAVAGDIGHALSRAAALARAHAGPEGAAAERPAGRTRSRLATALLGGAGLLAIVGALFVRVHWHNPALTALGVVIALALGICGLLYLLTALWIMLTGRAPRTMLTR